MHLGCEITDIDFDRPALKYKKRKTDDPESDWMEYDLIVAADGVKSGIRRQMMALHGEVDEAQDTVSYSRIALLIASMLKQMCVRDKLLTEFSCRGL